MSELILSASLNAASEAVETETTQNNGVSPKDLIRSRRKALSGSRLKTLAVLLICSICLLNQSCGNSSKKVDIELIPVQTGEKWGYINKKGEYVINPQFKSGNYFKDGLARVKSSDDKVGYISKDGKFAINPQYKYGTDFSNGLAFVVSENGYPVCIDKSGNVKFEAKQAKTIYGFSEGMAQYVTNDDKVGFFNTSGQVAINPQFDNDRWLGAQRFSEGLAPVQSGDKWGYVDKQGKYVVNPQFAFATVFSEGLALANADGKYGFIDKQGKYIINPQFEQGFILPAFSEGLAAVPSGKQWGFIDAKGQYAINPQFEYVTEFSDGLAAVRSGDKWGFVDKKGKYVINPQFESAYAFIGNIAFVKSGGKWGIIDKNGKYLVNPQFESVREFSQYTSSVESDYFDTSAFASTSMVYVEGGTFTMGCTSEQGYDCDDDEKPAHQVTLSSYYIGKYEVTQDLWEAVMGSNPSYFKGDNLPVAQVSWDDVQEFIEKLNQKTGKQYRLPTEAEWEFAARGGTKSKGYKYSGSNSASSVAWYDDNSGNKTHPVGTKSPNELGVYDMSGNVYEWCNDWYGSYSSVSQTNPRGASIGSGRVNRGGSWFSNAGNVRVSFRGSNTPGFRNGGLGVRLASSSK